MAAGADPRLDRVIAALNSLEASQRSQSDVIERMQAEIAAAQRDAAAAREAAAFAKAETAAYQAELASTVRRGDIDRISERLDETANALAGFHRNDSQAASVRDQVVKLSRALRKAVTVTDLAEVAQRMEQIDDRLQVRMDQLASEVATVTHAGSELHSMVAQVSGDAGDVGQALDRRVQALEASQSQLADRFDRVVVTAEAEIERVAGHLEKRVIDLMDRLEVQSATIAGLPDPEPAIDLLTTEVADLNRSLRVLRSTIESERTVVRELDQRVFGADGVAPRLMQLAQVVVERNEREPLIVPHSTDPLLLEFHGRLEDLVTRVESLSALRTRVELIERRFERPLRA